MVTFEQIKLLETKVAKAIDYVNRLTGENTMLREKLAGYETKIDELEVLIKQFKEDQSRIESGILSALDRLNQFEDAIEKGIAKPLPEKEKAAEPMPPEAPVSSSSAERSKPAEKADESDPALFSETSPAEDSDEAIMAALEKEEQEAKEKQPGGQTAELDIF